MTSTSSLGPSVDAPSTDGDLGPGLFLGLWAQSRSPEGRGQVWGGEPGPPACAPGHSPRAGSQDGSRPLPGSATLGKCRNPCEPVSSSSIKWGLWMLCFENRACSSELSGSPAPQAEQAASTLASNCPQSPLSLWGRGRRWPNGY